jgi:hypothetical protein
MENQIHAKIEKMLSMILTQEHDKLNLRSYNQLKDLLSNLASKNHKWISK